MAEPVTFLLHSVGRTARTVRNAMNQQFMKANLGLTLEQFILLSKIEEAKTIHQNTLVQCFSKDKAVFTRILSNLEKHAYISRDTDSADRRVKVISLTEKGEKFLHSANTLHKKFREQIKEILSIDEMKSISTSLNKLISGLTETENESKIEDNIK